MSAQLEVPSSWDLADLGIVLEESDSPGVASITVMSGSGGRVTLTWDEIAGAVSVRWTEGGRDCLVLARETASKVSVRDLGSSVEFRVWSSSPALGGELVLEIGETVSVRDVLLRV
jgi:hypothetical protein